jgi:hypothetical protein
MLDMRDRDVVVAKLCDAQRRFERGGPVPLVARELLHDLADALADSGPLELDVTAESWLNAVRAVDRGVSSADADPSTKTVRRAKRALRSLERFFGSKKELFFAGTTGRWATLALARRWNAFPHPADLGCRVGRVARRADAIWIGIVIGGLALLTGLIVIYHRRYRPDVRAAAKWLRLSDRPLFANVVSEKTERAKGTLLYVHPVLLATDHRLVLARAAHAARVSSDRHEFELAWEIPYRDIAAFSSKRVGNEDPKERVSIQSQERQVTYELIPAEGKALVAILKRRAPEALTEAPAPAR